MLGTAPHPLLRTFEQKWWEAPVPGCVSRSVRCRAQETWKGTRCHSLLRPPEPRVRAWGGGAGCTPTRPAQSWLPQGPPASPALGWQPRPLPPLPFASWGFSPSLLGTVPPRGREGPRGTVAHSGSRPERPTLSRPHFQVTLLVTPCVTCSPEEGGRVPAPDGWPSAVPPRLTPPCSALF